MENRIEGMVLSESLTPRGWKQIKLLDGKEVEVDPSDEVTEAVVPPKGFKDAHVRTMSVLYAMIDRLEASGRKVPVLREEIVEGVGIKKGLVKDLEKFGFIEIPVIEVSTGGRSLGGRAVVVPSIKGKVWMRYFWAAINAAQKKAQQNAPATAAVEESRPSDGASI